MFRSKVPVKWNQSLKYRDSLESLRYSTAKPSPTASEKGAPRTEPKAETGSAGAKPPPSSDNVPPHRSSIFPKLLALGVVGVGGVVAYAGYDSSFRNKLEFAVPYSKESLAIIFGSIDPAVTKEDSLPPRPLVAQPKPAIAPSPESPKAEPAKVASETKKQPVAEATKTASTPTLSEKELRAKKEFVLKEDERKKRELDSERESVNQRLDALLNDRMARLTKTLENAASSHEKLVEALTAHKQLLTQAMEMAEDDATSDNLWRRVTESHAQKSSLLRSLEEVVLEARMSAEELKQTVDEAKSNPFTRNNALIREKSKDVNVALKQLDEIVSKTERLESTVKVMASYRNLVEEARRQFHKEVQSLLPEAQVNVKKKQLTEEEKDALIAHAHRRIEQVQRQMAKQQVMETERVEKALEHQRSEDDKLSSAQLRQTAEAARRQAELEFQDRESRLREEHEGDVRTQLSRQAAAHSDHLTQILRIHEEELRKQFERQTEERLQQQRLDFIKDINSSMTKLRGIEAAVDSRADIEKRIRRAQDLWLACQTLKQKMRSSADGVPLRSEFDAVKKATQGLEHPLVEQILASFPSVALDRGVISEDVLRNRFDKVYRLCRRVALIDERGGSLFRYFVSWMQSLFLVRSSAPDTANIGELLVDPSIDLDTVRIVDLAKICLERDELELALRLMNQLRGAPRQVAQGWIEDTRLLLEARQASRLLTAYAAAQGLGTMPQGSL